MRYRDLHEAAGAAAGIVGGLLTRGYPTVVLPETLLTFQVTAPVTIETNSAPQAFRFVEPADYPPVQAQSQQTPAYPAPAPAVYHYPYYVYCAAPYYSYYYYPYYYPISDIRTFTARRLVSFLAIPDTTAIMVTIGTFITTWPPHRVGMIANTFHGGAHH